MEIFVGIDVAKETHWVCALNHAARVLLDRAVENDQAAIDRLVADPAWPRQCSRDRSGHHRIAVSWRPSSWRWAWPAPRPRARHRRQSRRARLCRRRAQVSDPRDAHTIADLVRTRPLRPILPDDDTVIALRLKVMRRRELTDDQTRRVSRLR
ncbi:transposase [Mesorhizobium sp.]|uniref:IS110 family transposase n=1 Tax=Mesorhizobium sp. TaxID=1871066 RepID=UPI00345D668A